QHVADLVKRHEEVALPPRISGVGLGEALGYGERGAEAHQRRRQVALFDQHGADPIVRHEEVALPPRISGVGLGQALEALRYASTEPFDNFQCGTRTDLFIDIEHKMLGYVPGDLSILYMSVEQMLNVPKPGRDRLRSKQPICKDLCRAIELQIREAWIAEESS